MRRVVSKNTNTAERAWKHVKSELKCFFSANPPNIRRHKSTATEILSNFRYDTISSKIGSRNLSKFLSRNYHVPKEHISLSFEKRLTNFESENLGGHSLAPRADLNAGETEIQLRSFKEVRNRSREFMGRLNRTRPELNRKLKLGMHRVLTRKTTHLKTDILNEGRRNQPLKNFVITTGAIIHTFNSRYLKPNTSGGEVSRIDYTQLLPPAKLIALKEACIRYGKVALNISTVPSHKVVISRIVVNGRECIANLVVKEVKLRNLNEPIIIPRTVYIAGPHREEKIMKTFGDEFHKLPVLDFDESTNKWSPGSSGTDRL